MRLQLAMDIINTELDWREAYGFRVDMDHTDGYTIGGDGFPETHVRHNREHPISTLEEALDLAKRFAKKVDPKEYVNIHVVYCRDLKHVDVPDNILWNPYK